MAHVEQTFRVHADPTEALRSAGWTVQREGDVVVADHGSALRTRLLGGWFVGEQTLPKHLRATPDGGGYAVTAEDRMGFGIFDPKMRKKYERTFAALERELTGA